MYIKRKKLCGRVLKIYIDNSAFICYNTSWRLFTKLLRNVFAPMIYKGVTMYIAFIIALVILLYTLQSLFTRLYTDYYPGDKGLTTPVFAVVCGIIVTVVSFIFSGFTFSCGWLTVLLGIINAAILYGYDAFIIRASATGPYDILHYRWHSCSRHRILALLQRSLLLGTACIHSHYLCISAYDKQ